MAGWLSDMTKAYRTIYQSLQALDQEQYYYLIKLTTDEIHILCDDSCIKCKIVRSVLHRHCIVGGQL